jgi:hypothetical protein
MNTKWYWGKIGLGALAIFCVGFAGISLVRTTKRQVVRAVETSADLTIPLPFVPFNFDGERLGTFRKIVFHRSSPETVTSVDVTVRLNDPGVAARLESCHLTIDDLDNLDERSSFHCVAPSPELESFGTVAVYTRGEGRSWSRAATVPLLLPKHAIGRLHGHDGAQQAARMEQRRFRELSDSMKVLADRFGNANGVEERQTLRDQMEDLEAEMSDLREAIVDAAVERAAATAEAAVRRAEAAGSAVDVKVSVPGVEVTVTPKAKPAPATPKPARPEPPQGGR